MKWRYAMRMAVASPSRSRATSCCPGTHVPPLPARCSPGLVLPSSSGTGGVFRTGVGIPAAGFVTPSPISCHDIPQGSLPGADLSTNTGRDNAAGPLPHSSPPHPEDAPGSPKNRRRGGDFHLAKNGDRKLAIDTRGTPRRSRRRRLKYRTESSGQLHQFQVDCASQMPNQLREGSGRPHPA